MSFPQLGYPQYLSASQAVYGGERPGVLSPSSRGGNGDIAASPSAAAAAAVAVSSVLGMYTSPYTAHNYSAFLPYSSADLALFSQMGSQYDLKDSPGLHPASFATHTSPAFYPYGQFQYGDPARPKNATRESTSTLKAWLNEHRKNPYPTKGEKIMLAIITKMTLTQVSTWFANARRRLKKENKVTWGARSSKDEDGNLFGSDTEADAEKNEDEEEIDLESIDIDKIDDNDGEQSNDEDEDKAEAHARGELDSLDKRRALALHAHEAFDKAKGVVTVSKEATDSNNNDNPTNNNPTTRVLSPGGQGGGFPLPASNKPKIWSLAETATSPDSAQKPASPAAAHAHPAFISSHGLYTCQIGKFHNWTNGSFLGQNSLLNVRSFLGVNQHHHHHHHHHNQHLHAQQQQQQHATPVSAVTGLSSEKNPEDLSPKHIDRGNVVRNESPTQPLKSSFRPLHDSPRSQQESTQRVLTALSSA